jgi:hypothetical protein
MRKPKVLNKYKDYIPKKAVYVGRPTKWGNPYGLGMGREWCLHMFEFNYLAKHPELIEAAKKELKGKDLVCFCAPLRCHADIWLRIANEEES